MSDGLASYYAAKDESESEHRLVALLSIEADRPIRAIVRSKLGSSPDADDVCADVIVDLMVRLRQTKSGAGVIEDFNGYVAAAAYNACNNYLRRKNPLRWRLRNRFLYVLKHDSRFAVWDAPGRKRLCGLAAWRGLESIGRSPREDHSELEHNSPPADLLLSVFRLSGGPLEVNGTIDLGVELSGVRSDPANVVMEALPDRNPGIDRRIEQKGFATELWTEICALPLPQRLALLLNLSDDGVNLFVLTGVAHFREIAEALVIQAEEFAVLFHDLPLEDNIIAARLGLTRQQVINLRMSARKRLSNRISGRS
jgi:RNA polymerase sigma factor (sigma-70 family)